MIRSRNWSRKFGTDSVQHSARLCFLPARVPLIPLVRPINSPGGHKFVGPLEEEGDQVWVAKDEKPEKGINYV